MITRLPESIGRPGGARRSLFDLAPGATGIMRVMTIEAVVFDIGGVLEITPDLGVTGMWECRLGLGPGELNKRMYDVWRGGSIGTISERDVHQAVSERLGLDERQLAECMADIWREYLATAAFAQPVHRPNGRHNRGRRACANGRYRDIDGPRIIAQRPPHETSEYLPSDRVPERPLPADPAGSWTVSTKRRLPRSQPDACGAAVTCGSRSVMLGLCRALRRWMRFTGRWPDSASWTRA